MSPYREKGSLPLWEYCEKHTPRKTFNMVVLANQMARDGWELVAVLESASFETNEYSLTGIFKRIKL